MYEKILMIIIPISVMLGLIAVFCVVKDKIKFTTNVEQVIYLEMK